MNKGKEYTPILSQRRRIAVIGIVGIPANYGGFETLIEYLVENLGNQVDFTVYCSSFNYPMKKPRVYNNARLRYIPISANGISSVLYDSVCIMHSLFIADTILVLGVSGAFLLPLVRLITNKKIITNIDGLEWKREKWGKMAKYYLYHQEKIAIKSSHKIIADNLGIKEYIHEKYGFDSDLIAYGGSHAFPVKLSDQVIEKYFIKRPYAFTVCRIEPENNIHLILEGFSRSNFNLVFIGNWDASEYGRRLKLLYKNFTNINIVDPIYDQGLLNEIRSNCLVYVHGHSAGGTNPSLVEAMWLGLPVVAWDVNYNRNTTEDRALYFNSVNSLNEILDGLTSDHLSDLSNKLKEIAIRRYSWESIAKDYFRLFK